MTSINIFSPYFMVIYVTSTVRVTNWMSYDASANHDDGTMNKMTNHDQQLTVPRYLVNVSFLQMNAISIYFSLPKILLSISDLLIPSSLLIFPITFLNCELNYSSEV